MAEHEALISRTMEGVGVHRLSVGEAAELLASLHIDEGGADEEAAS